MGFYMCPLDPKVKNIFIGNEAGLLKERVPISVRASRAMLKYNNKCEIPNTDWQKNSKHKLTLGYNLISLKISNKVDNNIISTSLARISPIFEGMHLNFNVTGVRDKNETHISIKLFDLEIQCAGDYNDCENYLGALDFAILHSHNEINIYWIKSRRGGKDGGIGGKMITWLYNIAKDLSIQRIFFYPDNTLAKQFYYHMDFGSNDYEKNILVYNRRQSEWKVDVK